MFSFFESISGFITTFVDFIVNLFSMMLGFLKLIVNAFGFIIRVINLLPPFLIPFALAFICIAILFQILNKGS